MVNHGNGSMPPRATANRCSSDSPLVVTGESWTEAGDDDGPKVLIASQSRRTCSIDGFAQTGFANPLGQPITAEALREGPSERRRVGT